MLNPAEQMPLAVGSPASADEIWPGWKGRVQIGAGVLSEHATILINAVRCVDEAGPDGTAAGLEIS